MERRLAVLATTMGFLGVALGALGAHGVKGLVGALPDAAERLAWWETAARYHLVHALALGLVAVVARQAASKAPAVAAGLFTLGVALFSGSLYALALTGTRSLGLVTPFGGLCFLAGWVALGVAAWRAPAPAP